jgi:pyruvoyl-dependent arginine decarboxylase (PvlArgDC)
MISPPVHARASSILQIIRFTNQLDQKLSRGMILEGVKASHQTESRGCVQEAVVAHVVLPLLG